MAPSRQARKEAAKLEPPEDEERFPRLNDTNRSEYEIVAEIDNDLQAMVDQGVLGPDEPVDVARNVFIPHRQGTHKTPGDRLILLWYGYLVPHRKGHMQLTPEGQTKFRVRFRDGYPGIVKTARTHCAHCTQTLCTIHCMHALCTLHACIVHTARTHCASCTQALCTLHARLVHTARRHCARRTHFTLRLHCANCKHALCTMQASTVHTAGTHCAYYTARTHCACCTHTLCTVHTRTVHTARTHCGHCTHALCTLHAHIVHTARRHPLCTLHTCIVHTAHTHCEHSHCAHGRIVHISHKHCEHAHCAHRTHALCTLHCPLAGPLYLLNFVGHTWEHSLGGIGSSLLHGGLLDQKKNPTPIGEHGDRGL